MRRRALMALLGGAALACPLPLRAQKKMPVIGFLGLGPRDPMPGVVSHFLAGLEETGYVAGRNVMIEYRWAESRADRLPALAADLVGRKVDLIATEGGSVAAQAAQKATSEIPIVFTGSDPVGEGLVASLARPGGNLTGISSITLELTPKRLELLSELVPQARVIGLLVHPGRSYTPRLIKTVEQAATGRGLQLAVVNGRNVSEIDAAFASLVRRQAGGVVVAPDGAFGHQRAQIVPLASRHALPATYHGRAFIVVGGLMTYAPDLYAVYRQAGTYAGRILKGERPADLPVQQPTKFELVINLKTANALGITVPHSILARADEVIE